MTYSFNIEYQAYGLSSLITSLENLLKHDSLIVTIKDNLWGNTCSFNYVKPLSASIIDKIIDVESTIYPNPSSGLIHVEASAIEVYNILGTKIYENQSNNNTFDLHSLPNGIYTIQAYHQNQFISTQKLRLN